MMRLRILGLPLILLVLSGCAGSAGTAGSAVSATGRATCAGDEQTAKLCRRALPIAIDRLGVWHWPISTADFRSSTCTSNVRCRLAQGDTDQGWLIFTFWVGDPVMVNIQSQRQADGEGFELVAELPQPVPAPLLEEISGGPVPIPDPRVRGAT